MTGPYSIALGLLCAVLYTLLESAQFVYFGALFQHLSPFLFGALVFGLTVLLLVGHTLLFAADQFSRALRVPGTLIAINIGAVITFSCYLLSVRLLEPAITYTISAGSMPITAWLLYRTGWREHGRLRNRLESSGTLLMAASIGFLAAATIAGLSGFVRGDWRIAAAGVVLAIADGVFFTLILVYSQRLSRAGVGAAAALGLRLPLYVLVSAAIAAGTTDVASLPSTASLAIAVATGIALLVPPLYLLQKAAGILSTLTLSAITTLGPFCVLALQWLEGRVAYSQATTAGLLLYMLGAALVAIGSVSAERAAGAVRANDRAAPDRQTL